MQTSLLVEAVLMSVEDLDIKERLDSFKKVDKYYQQLISNEKILSVEKQKVEDAKLLEQRATILNKPIRVKAITDKFIDKEFSKQNLSNIIEGINKWPKE